MVVIKGKQYARGVHEVDGELIQVIDNSTWKVIGKLESENAVQRKTKKKKTRKKKQD